MNKFRCIKILLLVAFIGGCATQKNYFVKMNPNFRDKISAIDLWIQHDKSPGEDAPYMKVRSSSSGTYAWPLGASRDWSPEKYRETLNKSMRVLSQNLESSYPDNSIIQRMFSNIATNTNHIPINVVYGETQPKDNDTLLNLSIYHKIRVSVSSNEPNTYMGIVAKMVNSDGTIIYHRRVFTSNIVIPDQFLQDEYNTYFESSLQNAIKTFWTDIFGG